MIDKISGKVAYAVMSFGCLMGIGEDYYPVPWSQLTYDTSLGGYRITITKEQLDRAPSVAVCPRTQSAPLAVPSSAARSSTSRAFPVAS